MPFERWGSLSVDDHLDTRALVANVLLYDRLVVPTMSPQSDRDELGYWLQKGWDPELQRRRVVQLEDLAVERPWTNAYRQRFRTRHDELTAERHDAVGIAAGSQLTRMILAEEKVVQPPPGVHGATVVAAYSSGAAFARDFYIGEDDHIAEQAYLLSRRLAIPDYPDPEQSLAAAIELSRDDDFRRKRRELYDWQSLAQARKWSAQEAVERVVEMTDAYNEAVQKAVKTVWWKYAFTVFGIAAGFAFGGPAGAAASAALTLMRFAMLDRKPAVAAGSAEPAAMFHDMDKRFGITLL